MKRYLFPSDYMADPATHVFNGRVYIYPSHDRDAHVGENDNGDHFQMKDYYVLSTDNLMEGEIIDHGKILDVEDIPWAGGQLWDSDVAEKDGKYYLYFSMKDKTGVFHIGVAVADKPEGPFIPQSDPIRGSYSIDPCVLKDGEDYYIYFGGIWGGQLQWYKNNQLVENPVLPKGTEIALRPKVAKLSKDMLQFAEEPKDLILLDENDEPIMAEDPHHFFEASWIHKYNGKYYYSWSTGDTHLLCYGIGDNPYGPFKFQGVIMTPVVGWTTHHSIVEHNGKWYLLHHDCKPSNGVTWLRSLKVCELEYDENGKIKTIDGIVD